MSEGGSRVQFAAPDLELAALGDKLAKAAEQCFSAPDPLVGPQLDEFESALTARTGRAFAVCVGSCTDALFFAMRAAGLGPGDDVLVSAYSFVATASAIRRTGARPVFVDIEHCTPAPGRSPFSMSLEQAAQAVTANTRAMVWVELFGGLSEPAPVEEFARDHGLMLFEDAAQSFGASIGNHRAGTLGLASCFSFDRQKVLGSPGTGGAVVTDDEDIAERVRSLRWHGKRDGAVMELGYNSQFSSFFAAVLLLKLELLPDWIAARNRVAQIYDESLAGLPLELLAWPGDVAHAWHKYVLVSAERERLQSALRSAGIPTKRHYPVPLHHEPIFEDASAPDGCPTATRLSAQAFSLPMHPFITDEEALGIARVLQDAF